MALNKDDKKLIIGTWVTCLGTIIFMYGFIYYIDGSTSEMFVWNTKNKMFLGGLLMLPILWTVIITLTASIRDTPRPPSWKEINKELADSIAELRKDYNNK